MIDKKVSQKINENKITLKDILTRKKHWKKPGKEGYRDLVLWIGWKWWNKEYNYLPIPDKFMEIQKETLEQLKEKPKESYYIIRNKDGVLTIVLQNPRSYDFLDNRNVLFFGNDSEATKPFLYWITGVDYANNETLYCQITAERCPIWAYYGNFMNGRGTANIEKSQLGMEHNGHLDSDSDDKEQRIDKCWACENCFDFCDDLKAKRAKPGEIKRRDEIEVIPFSWQPRWGVVYIDPCDMTLAPDGFRLPDADISIASGFTLRQWNSSVGAIKTLLPKMDTPYLLFLVSKTHWAKIGSESLPFDAEELTQYKGNSILYPLPDIYNQQPHLLNHSSVQFFFQKKLVHTANLKHIEIKKIDGKFHLSTDLTIRSSIAGILYQFQSKEIFFRIELKVQGAFSNNKALKLMMNVLKGAWGSIQSTIGNVISGIPVIGGFGRAASEQGKKAEEAAKTKPPTGKELTEQVLGGELISNDHPEREQQTKRMKQSTTKSQHRIVEPSIFYSNTVDFNYDFWEFANRAIKNPFEIRFEHSDMLYNNLVNSNNKSPLQNIFCRYSAFKQLVKVGHWQGEVSPWWDYKGTWRNICGSGTFFYDKVEELFKPWKPTFKLTESYTFGSLADIGNIVGEEEIIETDRDEKVASGQTGDVGYAHSTFLRTTNLSQLTLLKNVKGCSSDWSDEYGWCWGCFSHGINTHGGDGTEFECQGTFDPTEDTDIEFYLKKNNQVQRQVASCKVGNSYKVVLKRTGTTIDIYFRFKDKDVRYKAEIRDIEKQETYEAKEFIEPEWTDDNTQYNSLIGEVDPEGFEGEPPEQEKEQNQENEKPEKEIKEKSGEIEREFEKELEKEKEKEAEREKERQLERELEREKEKEREKERDLEKEKLRESELQTEKDKKARDAQWEKDKKTQERLEREAKFREKERKRKEQRQKDKEKKDRERKEKE